MPTTYSVYPNKAMKKPKRCLTAYNFFFQHERQCLLDSLPVRFGVKSSRSHGKIQFDELAKIVSSKWKQTTPHMKAPFQRLAEQDKIRYDREIKEWKAKLQTNASSLVFVESEAQNASKASVAEPCQNDLHNITPSSLSFHSQEPQCELDEESCNFILSALK